MKILHVASEVAPYSKTGGLGDVPARCRARSPRAATSVTVVTPRYRSIDPRTARRLAAAATAPCGVARRGRRRSGRGRRERPGASASSITAALRSRRASTARAAATTRDNARASRCSAAPRWRCRARDRLRARRRARPRLAGRAGPVPAPPRARAGRALGRRATVFTIHNLAYQGVFPKAVRRRRSGCRWDVFRPRRSSSTASSASSRRGSCSPTAHHRVARATRGRSRRPSRARASTALLRARATLTGILNGVDYDVWSPRRDPHLPARYSARRPRRASALQGGAAARARAAGAPRRAAVGDRLAARRAEGRSIWSRPRCPSSSQGDVQFVVLGSGEPALEDALARAARRASRRGWRCASATTRRWRTASRPAPTCSSCRRRFEPCGLNQMYSLRYGTPPIVRATGGLDDTVVDFDGLAPGTGFKFERLRRRPRSLVALRRALDVYRDRRAWRGSSAAAWPRTSAGTRSAGGYEALYRPPAHRLTGASSAAPALAGSTRSRAAAGWGMRPATAIPTTTSGRTSPSPPPARTSHESERARAGGRREARPAVERGRRRADAARHRLRRQPAPARGRPREPLRARAARVARGRRGARPRRRRPPRGAGGGEGRSPSCHPSRLPPPRREERRKRGVDRSGATRGRGRGAGRRPRRAGGRARGGASPGPDGRAPAGRARSGAGSSGRRRSPGSAARPLRCRARPRPGRGTAPGSTARGAGPPRGGRRRRAGPGSPPGRAARDAPLSPRAAPRWPRAPRLRKASSSIGEVPREVVGRELVGAAPGASPPGSGRPCAPRAARAGGATRRRRARGRGRARRPLCLVEPAELVERDPALVGDVGVGGRGRPRRDRACGRARWLRPRSFSAIAATSTRRAARVRSFFAVAARAPRSAYSRPVSRASRAGPSRADVELGRAEERLGVGGVDRERTRPGEPRVVEPPEGREGGGPQGEGGDEAGREPHRVLRAGEGALTPARVERVVPLLDEGGGGEARPVGEARCLAREDPVAHRCGRAGDGRGQRPARGRRGSRSLLARARGDEEQEPQDAAGRAKHRPRACHVREREARRGVSERGSGYALVRSITYRLEPRRSGRLPLWDSSAPRPAGEPSRHAPAPRRRPRLARRLHPPRAAAARAGPRARGGAPPRHVRQLTFGGENAEAYWSPDGRKLIFQSTRDGATCDQEFVMDLATARATGVSSGKGRTTCGYFYPRATGSSRRRPTRRGAGLPADARPLAGLRVAALRLRHLHGEARRLRRQAARSARRATTPRRRLPKGGRIVFTSTRDGDLDLYKMDEDGNERHAADEHARLRRRRVLLPGRQAASSGARAGRRRARSSRSTGRSWQGARAPDEARHLRDERRRHEPAPGDPQRRGELRPVLHADGSRIIFASNVGDPRGPELRPLPRRTTTAPGSSASRLDARFDGFPMFSPDGKRPRLRLEPEREAGGRDERVRRRLGRVAGVPSVRSGGEAPSERVVRAPRGA